MEKNLKDVFESEENFNDYLKEAVRVFKEIWYDAIDVWGCYETLKNARRVISTVNFKKALDLIVRVDKDMELTKEGIPLIIENSSNADFKFKMFYYLNESENIEHISVWNFDENDWIDLK